MIRTDLAHPWHGIDPGNDTQQALRMFIEMVPSDTVKYEIDKDSGFLILDRPQKYSNIMPALYGFIPRTYCNSSVANRCMEQTGLKDIQGDGDPIDVVVLTEREIPHGNILVNAIAIGGFRMIDGGEADDKIVAVLKNDAMYGSIQDISELPEAVVNRLRHYFLTYKGIPGETQSKTVSIPQVYNREEAIEVINCSRQDYKTSFEGR